MINDEHDGLCADYALSFLCRVPVEEVGFELWKTGRPAGCDAGVTDAQISKAVKALGFRRQAVHTVARTLRVFARIHTNGEYLVTTTDHCVAVIDGRVCDTPQTGDLLRIEKVERIVKESFDSCEKCGSIQV
jgi:hypothetical protein